MKYLVLIAMLSLSLFGRETIKTLDSKEIEVAGKTIRVAVLCVGGFKFAYATRYSESSTLSQIMKKGDAIGSEPIPCK